MNKKILIIGLIIMLVGVLIGLTGCGNSKTKITDDLNSVINDEVAEWKEKGYGATLSVYNIQSMLKKKNLQYTIVASGDTEFTKSPETTEYKEKDIQGYSGKSYDNLRVLDDEMNVKYFVVYEIDTQKYYNVEVNYEKADLNGAKKDYPVFSNAKEIK